MALGPQTSWSEHRADWLEVVRFLSKAAPRSGQGVSRLHAAQSCAASAASVGEALPAQQGPAGPVAFTPFRLK